MNIMESIINAVEFLEKYWVDIVIAAGLCVITYRNVREFINLDTDKKVEIAKKQIAEVMLKLVTDAEERYDGWIKAGAIKRAQVIERIYADYPVLKKVINQDALTVWIDFAIDEALAVMRQIVKDNMK